MEVLSIARESCISDPVLLWAIIIGNVLIFIAYTWIPVSIVRVLSSQSKIPQPALWMLASVFIAFCGISHLIGVVVIFQPYYGLESGMLILTAVVSLIAGIVLHRAVRPIRQAMSDYDEMVEKVRTLMIDLDREKARHS